MLIRWDFGFAQGQVGDGWGGLTSDHSLMHSSSCLVIVILATTDNIVDVDVDSEDIAVPAY